MLADWHAHYPMHVLVDLTPETSSELMRAKGQPTIRDRARALILRLANRIGNLPSWDGEYRVTPGKLRKGEVGLAMSVLFRPFAEMDLSKPYGAPPDRDYFKGLIEDLESVEKEVAGQDPSQIRMVTNRAQLDEAIGAGATALVHAVEGGFHLGDTDAEIKANCETLQARGVGYVTVAHLFFRQVATNANALPFIPDPVYRVLFPQCGRDRLTDRGETLVGSLVENRILVDISHMDPPAIRETLACMDRLDPGRTMPVVSTHAGFRFGRQRYMHDEKAVRGIAARKGVIGLIMAQHQLNDGLRRKRDRTETLEESLSVIFRHIDEIHLITGSYDNIALGSDLDGFIKPTMGGIEDIADLRKLEQPLRDTYGDENAEKMMWGNSLRVLQTLWPKEEATQP